MRRAWIKLWISECLRGSIRIELTPDERSVWFDLLLLAGDSRVPGTICATTGVPYPDDFIINQLAITKDLFQRTIDKCIAVGRITKDGTGIRIVNWDRYQAPYYDRQKPYQGKKEKAEQDSDKYIKGSRGHMVNR